jgi:S1-C subfamily serine protease
MSRALSAALDTLLVTSLWGAPAWSAPDPAPPTLPPVRPRTERTVDALLVVKLRSKAVVGARSSRTLGAEREGAGVVLDAKGLVLTIGYLILEAETIELSTANDRAGDPVAAITMETSSSRRWLRGLGTLPA